MVLARAAPSPSRPATGPASLQTIPSNRTLASEATGRRCSPAGRRAPWPHPPWLQGVKTVEGILGRGALKVVSIANSVA